MKTSVVIGGSRGIGLAIYKSLKNRGDNVYVLSRNSHPSEENHIVFDLMSENFSNDCAKILNKISSIDNLIFCQKNRMKVDDYDYEFNLGVRSVYKFINNVKDHLQKNGSIIAMGSPAGQFIINDQTLAYHASKAALEQLVRYYAVKLGSSGVRVNCVLPGTVKKQENTSFYDNNDELKALFKKMIPLARQGTSEDVANLVDFLCSDKSSFITGQSFYVDGGLSILGQEALVRSISGI